MSFKFHLATPAPHEAEIVLTGSLDEFATLPDDLDVNSLSTVSINFKNLEFINSCGIKRWINFVAQFQNNAKITVSYFECPTFVIDQVNMVSGFLPENASIKSVLIDFFCDKCDQNFKVKKNLESMTEIPTEKELLYDFRPTDCDVFPECKSSIEVEIMPDRFFRFLKERK